MTKYGLIGGMDEASAMNDTYPIVQQEIVGDGSKIQTKIHKILFYSRQSNYIWIELLNKKLKVAHLDFTGMEDKIMTDIMTMTAILTMILTMVVMMMIIIMALKGHLLVC